MNEPHLHRESLTGEEALIKIGVSICNTALYLGEIGM